MKNSFLPQAMSITAIKDENTATKTLVLNGSMAADPGQFVMAWLPNLDEKPFSLAEASPVSLTIAAVGPFSRAVHQLQVGDRLWVRGPLGRGFQLPVHSEGGKKILLVGGGYGVAPLHFLAKQALAVGHQVAMIIGARNSANLLLVDAFQELGVPLWLTTEDGSTGRQGLVTEAMVPVLADPQMKPDLVYACGPTGMLVAIANVCRTEDVPFQVSWEAHMRCAIGLCGSCEVGPGWLICLDGPVFPFNPVDVPPVDLEPL
jgi:dihydroorotate dehydrogenase electron transfer subunit